MTRVAQKSGELAKRRGTLVKVDPVVEPSAEWGWHEHFPRAARVLGVLVAIIVLALLFNSHANWTEIMYVLGTAAILLLLVLLNVLRRRRAWRP
jgi:hypothetical protein